MKNRAININAVPAQMGVPGSVTTPAMFGIPQQAMRADFKLRVFLCGHCDLTHLVLEDDSGIFFKTDMTAPDAEILAGLLINPPAIKAPEVPFKEV